MKKELLITIILVSFIGGLNLFADVGRENISNHFNVLTSTSTHVTITNGGYYTSSYSDELKGVERIFHNENLVYRMKYQRGGDPSTVETHGMTLEPRAYFYDNTYMGNIYFIATSTNSVVMSISKLEKK